MFFFGGVVLDEAHGGSAGAVGACFDISCVHFSKSSFISFSLVVGLTIDKISLHCGQEYHVWS